MEKFVSKMVLGLLVGLVTALASCVSLPKNPPQSFGSDLVARQGESEIILNSSSNVGTLNVFLDGEMKQTMLPQDSIKFVVPNGQHTILVNWIGKNGYGIDVPVSGEASTVNADSQRYVFTIELPMWLIGTRVKLKQVSVTALTGSAARVATGIEGALERAAEQTMQNVPRRSRIAIVYITALDRSTTDYITGELEFIWVNAGYIITDRSQLDRLRQEQNFQLSGEIDDATAVSIGKFAGADIIVTGRVDGEGNLQRLRLRALDTQTAQVVGVASERL
jgi:hypothetical protein